MCFILFCRTFANNQLQQKCYPCGIVDTVEHSYNKPEIPEQTVCYKQEFVISKQFPMRYCSTWLRSLLCYIKKFVIEEFVIRVFHCIVLNGNWRFEQAATTGLFRRSWVSM